MFKVTQETVDKLHKREARTIQASTRARQLNLEKPFAHNATMVGIPWSAFSRCGHIPRSDKAAELLVEFDPASMEAVFVSHEWWMRPVGQQQWTARVELDGTGRAAFRFVGADDATAQPDYPDGHALARLKWRVLCDGVSELVRRGVLDASKEPLIWLDYFSVDQLDAESRDDALDSICHYVSMSKVLLIPTQQEGTICASRPEELDGYSSRGWCRCECIVFSICSQLLAASQGHKEAEEEVALAIYAASTSGDLTHLPRTAWSAAQPASGEVSMEADRAHIETIQRTALDASGRSKIRRACRAAQKLKVQKVQGGSLSLRDCTLCDLHMDALAARLDAGDLDALRTMDLTHNHLTDVAMDTLAAALRKHPLPKLEEINVEGNTQVTPVGLRVLAGGVGAGCKLLS